jgi:hypothetical protein
MAELLVRAVNRTHPDPERDRRGVPKKGDIVAVKPDGYAWEAGEGLPLFVRVLCPNLDHTLVENRIQPWSYDVDFTVVNSNVILDGVRVRATNTNAGTSAVAILTQNQLQPWLNQWNAVFVSAANGGVTFDFTVFGAATSEGFWRTNIGAFVFTELAYDQPSGVHDIEVDYSGDQSYFNDPERFATTVAQLAVDAGATVVSNTHGVAVIQVDRVTVRTRFRDYVTPRLGVYRRHRYHFTEAQVDTVIAAGGSVTLTVNQLNNAVRDRLTD